MEHFEIEQTRIAHDALGDAYNTSLVCSRLDLEDGLKNYEAASKILALRICSSDQEGNKAPDAVEHRAFTGYNERMDAFSDKLIAAPRCPVCSEHMKCGRWVNQGDKRYMSLCECKADGKFLVLPKKVMSLLSSIKTLKPFLLIKIIKSMLVKI